MRDLVDWVKLKVKVKALSDIHLSLTFYLWQLWMNSTYVTYGIALLSAYVLQLTLICAFIVKIDPIKRNELCLVHSIVCVCCLYQSAHALLLCDAI